MSTFYPITTSLILIAMFQQVETVITAPGVGKSIQQVFLVGGFAESRLLQEAVREKLNKLEHTNLIIPQV